MTSKGLGCVSHSGATARGGRAQMGPVGWVRLKYYQYELTTALYMLEPWEKTLFSTRPCRCGHSCAPLTRSGGVGGGGQTLSS
jgi:hypothetical protein